MKKITLGVVLLLVLAIGVAVLYLSSNINNLVKAAIEKYGTQVTQTAVRVENVELQLSKGAGTIHGLTIANPAGYSGKLAFSLGEISTSINIDSIIKDPLIIDYVTIAAPRVFFEMADLKKTNLDELKNNIAASAGQQAAPKEQQAETSKEINLLIRRITFTNGSIQAKVRPLNNKEYQIKLPDIKMKNIGGTKGAPPAEIAQQILNRLTDQARNAIKKQGLDSEVEKLKTRAKVRVEKEKQKLKAKVGEKLETEKSRVGEKLKGILGR